LNIVGISGLAGSGKDTAADYLVAHHNFVKVSLADPLKRICRDVFAFTDEQLFGPSYRRNEPDKRYPRSGTFSYPVAPPGALWIPIHGGHTLIDDDDLALVLEHKWCINQKEQGKRTSYVRRTTDSLKLHQLIMGEVPEGMVIDHVNGDGLDNRRANLRFCTHAQNRQNQSKRIDGASPFKGVGWVEDRKKWRAFIKVEGRQKTLGYFDREEEAALAYDSEAREIFGDFARLNSEMFLTPRYALQQLGTEYGRNCYQNVWVDYAIRMATCMNAGGHTYSAPRGLNSFSVVGDSEGVLERSKRHVVIPDVRFKNEIDALKAVGAKLYRLTRETAGLEGSAGAHQSEKEQQEVPNSEFHAVISNNGSKEALYECLAKLVAV
jgi:hypothetical protein